MFQYYCKKEEARIWWRITFFPCSVFPNLSFIFNIVIYLGLFASYELTFSKKITLKELVK